MIVFDIYECYLAFKLSIFMWVVYSQLEWVKNKFNLKINICFKCLTFWSVLIITLGNPFVAAYAAFIAYLIDRYILEVGIKL